VAALAAAIALAGMAVDRSSRAAESHPDFNGVWAVIQHDGPSDRFSMAADPPLSAKGHAVIDPYRAKYDVKKYDMEPNQYCVEHGMPTAMFGLGGMPMEVLLQPHRMSIFSEAANQFRRIFIDGRKMPDDFPPTPNGYSIGHWEGDTLVVETGALEEWYLARWPHSEHARFVERFSIKDAKDVKLPRPLRPGITLSGKILIDEMTMIDPDLYDKPASVTYYYRQLGDDEIFYDGCSQGLWQAEFDRRIEKGQTGKAQ
jgi:hypothetical protein